MKKLGSLGRFGDVMIMYLPPFLPQFCRNGSRYIISVTSPNRPGLPDFSYDIVCSKTQKGSVSYRTMTFKMAREGT